MSEPDPRDRPGGGAARPVPIEWVDAFAAGVFSGNPAGVCLLDGPAPEEGMQALAAELGLSETAYLWEEGDGFRLRWFTPTVEVGLCGHATVAAAHVLAARKRIPPSGKVRFHTRGGELSASAGEGRVEIDLPSDTPRPVEPPPALAARWPVVGAAAGAADLVIELADEDAVRAVDVTDAGTLAEIAALTCRAVAVTARGAHLGRADYVLRFFAPSVGVPEDPVTGSAQCVLAPYWAARLDRKELTAHQLSRRGGVLDVVLEDGRVRVGGRAVTVFAGVLSTDAERTLGGATRRATVVSMG